MKNISKKYPASTQDGGLNADDQALIVGNNQVVNAENVIWGSTDRGNTGVVEAIGGIQQLGEGLPSITFNTIGVATEPERDRILYFRACTTGPWHRIMCYDKALGQDLTVLLASQVVGGLNFSKDRLIHSARIIDGLLYWTDGGDKQYRINIDAALKLNNPSYDTTEEPYEAPMLPTVLTLLRKPPKTALATSRQTDPDLLVSNFGNNSFWFAYRYVYRDKETSVVSVHSPVVPYNLPEDTFNSVLVTVPAIELIDQDVQRVEIGVRVDDNSQFFGVKVWDKRVAEDAAAIAAHNAGTTPLSFTFYNDKVGEPWGDAYSVKPFERIPITSETLELGRNRLFLGNNLFGYTAPVVTSLGATFRQNTEGGEINAQWIEVVKTNTTFPFDVSTYYILEVYGTGSYAGYYFVGDLGDGISPPFPTTIAYDTPITWEYIGDTYGDIYSYFSSGPYYDFSVNDYPDSPATVTGSPFSQSLNLTRAFKSGGVYKLSVVFYDFGDRKCGITASAYVSGVPVSDATYRVPDREFGTESFFSQLQWTLSNTNAVNEIPDWATHYAITITQCLKTRDFLQGRAKVGAYSIGYVSRDANNEYEVASGATAYSEEFAGIAVNIEALQGWGAGYAFSQGDICNIYLSGGGSPYRLRIIDTFGRYIICELKNLGSLNNGTTDALFEIYTPYIQQSNEPFYEVGQYFPITAPGTLDRRYSVLSGNINGDVWLLERGTTSYITENMSPNDTYYQNWFTDSGRPNFIDRIGQVYKPNSIAWSNTFILGSDLNGLCEFEALSEKFVPYECGAIQKLQVTSKVQNEQGAIMLAVCKVQTASIYLGEVQLLGSEGNAFVAQSEAVIGTINVLKGNFGTNNPESVVEYRGQVFWVDVYNGRVMQYASNGLFPVSQYKMTRFWKQFCDTYGGLTRAQVEAFGNRPFIFTQVDPYHNMLLISIPKVLSEPPAGHLPDDPTTPNYFDIWDGKGKTLLYKLGVGEGAPYWMSAINFNAEYFASLRNELYSFRNGIIYVHNSPTYGMMYDSFAPSRLMMVVNDSASVIKILNGLSAEVNKIPAYVYIMAMSPYQQVTDIEDYEWRQFEGVWYAIVKRNKIRPTEGGFEVDGILTGEKMRSYAFFIMFEWVNDGTPLQVRLINANFDISKGQSNY